MSRIRNAVRSLASGYAAMLANILYTLGSVPLALHYLPKEQFGLWALVSQVANILLLLDLGMSSSVSRFLIDHKDNKSDGAYGSVVQTGCVVLLIQGACIALGGAALSFWLPGLMQVPEELSRIFVILVAGQCLLLGGSFVGRIASHMLQAHQRFDMINYGQIGQLACGFTVQWIAFHQRLGLYSLLWASLASVFFGTAFNTWAVFRLGLLPPRGSRGRPTMAVFRRVFAFGLELFLLSVGLQLLNASQIVIVSRTQGLVAGAVWSIATKSFALAFQFVQRIFDFSSSALGEMIVRGEHSTLRRRYRDVLLLTALAGVFVGASVAVCNGSFLQLWTKGEVSWAWQNDALMGVLLLLNVISRCQVNLAGFAKQVRTMRWIYFLEGGSFVVFAYLASWHWGMTGIIVVAIAANLGWSGAYGMRWASGYLGLPVKQILLEWLRPALGYLCLFGPAAGLIWWSTSQLPAWPRFALEVLLMTAVGLALMWRIGLDAHLRNDLTRAWRGLRFGRAEIESNGVGLN